MSLKGRLGRLEAEQSKAAGEEVGASYWSAMVLCKTVERHHAGLRGEKPPPYSQEEIEELRRQDEETLAGGLEELRRDPGWQTPEARELLASWEATAQNRLEAAKDLPPERWVEVWGVDDEDEREAGS